MIKINIKVRGSRIMCVSSFLIKALNRLISLLHFRIGFMHLVSAVTILVSYL